MNSIKLNFFQQKFLMSDVKQVKQSEENTENQDHSISISSDNFDKYIINMNPLNNFEYITPNNDKIQE